MFTSQWILTAEKTEKLRLQQVLQLLVGSEREHVTCEVKMLTSRKSRRVVVVVADSSRRSSLLSARCARNVVPQDVQHKKSAKNVPSHQRYHFLPAHRCRTVTSHYTTARDARPSHSCSAILPGSTPNLSSCTAPIRGYSSQVESAESSPADKYAP